jgi:hypothetical protein
MSRLNDPPEVHNKTRHQCAVRDFFLSITKAATIYGECAVPEGAAPSAVQWLRGITDRMFLVRLNRRIHPRSRVPLKQDYSWPLGPDLTYRLAD